MIRAPTTQDLLQAWLDSRDEAQFAGIAGVWDPARGHYRYKVISLSFPDSVLEQAGGQLAPYTYQLTTRNNRVLRALKALVPASRELLGR